MPEQWHGKRMWAIAGQFAGSQDDAEKILAPMRALGPEFDLFQPMPYTVMQGLIDGANPVRPPQLLAGAQPGGLRRQADRHAARAVGDDAVAVQRAARPQHGRRDRRRRRRRNGARRTLGAVLGAPEHDVGGRRATTSANIAWTRGATEAFTPWISSGMALNFYTEVGDDEIADSFGARLARLKTVKQKYDPGNLFRLNQNIKP